MAATPWYLAIDFGTSRTAAAVVVGDREPELVRFEGPPDPRRDSTSNGRRNWMPSAVFVQADGDYRTGAEAIAALGGERPEQVVLTPKLRIAEGRDTQDVGIGTIPTYKLVAEVLKTAYRAACRQVGAGENGLGSCPDAVSLTCPVGWTAEARSDLRAAADHAGIRTAPKLISEPEAAAGHFHAALSEGDIAAIYDLGGGTCDIAVVRREGEGFRTLAKEYSDLIGGELFDDLLYYRHVLPELGSQNAQARERLELIYHDPTSRHLKARQQWRGCERQLRRNVSEAKERLSASKSEGVHVPAPVEVDVTVGKNDFEAQIRRDVDRTAALLRKCVDRALGEGGELKVVYLVGGSSLIPLAQARVRRTLRGVAVQVPSEALAKAPVALGAVTALARRERGESAKERELQELRARAEEEPRRREAAAEQAAALKRHRRACSDWLEQGDLIPSSAASRQALAAAIQLGEAWRYIAGCAPPGAVLNGAILLTSHRVLWVREKLDGTPLVSQLAYKQITAVRTAGSNSLFSLRQFASLELVAGGAEFTFGMMPQAVIDELATRIRRSCQANA